MGKFLFFFCCYCFQIFATASKQKTTSLRMRRSLGDAVEHRIRLAGFGFKEASFVAVQRELFQKLHHHHDDLSLRKKGHGGRRTRRETKKVKSMIRRSICAMQRSIYSFANSTQTLEFPFLILGELQGVKVDPTFMATRWNETRSKMQRNFISTTAMEMVALQVCTDIEHYPCTEGYGALTVDELRAYMIPQILVYENSTGRLLFDQNWSFMVRNIISIILTVDMFKDSCCYRQFFVRSTRLKDINPPCPVDAKKNYDFKVNGKGYSILNNQMFQVPLHHDDPTPHKNLSEAERYQVVQRYHYQCAVHSTLMAATRDCHSDYLSHLAVRTRKLRTLKQECAHYLSCLLYDGVSYKLKKPEANQKVPVRNSLQGDDQTITDLDKLTEPTTTTISGEKPMPTSTTTNTPMTTTTNIPTTASSTTPTKTTTISTTTPETTTPTTTATSTTRKATSTTSPTTTTMPTTTSASIATTTTMAATTTTTPSDITTTTATPTPNITTTPTSSTTITATTTKPTTTSSSTMTTSTTPTTTTKPTTTTATTTIPSTTSSPTTTTATTTIPSTTSSSTTTTVTTRIPSTTSSSTTTTVTTTPTTTTKPTTTTSSTTTTATTTIPTTTSSSTMPTTSTPTTMIKSTTTMPTTTTITTLSITDMTTPVATDKSTIIIAKPTESPISTVAERNDLDETENPVFIFEITDQENERKVAVQEGDATRQCYKECSLTVTTQFINSFSAVNEHRYYDLQARGTATNELMRRYRECTKHCERMCDLIPLPDEYCTKADPYFIRDSVSLNFAERRINCEITHVKKFQAKCIGSLRILATWIRNHYYELTKIRHRYEERRKCTKIVWRILFPKK